MKMLKTTLTAVAIAALTSAAAFAATEPSEDVTAAINNDQTDTTSLPSMQPSSGDTSTPTTNTTSPADSSAPPTSTVPPDTTAATNTTSSTATASSDAINAQKIAMRRLADDELSYTRNYIISSVGGLRDLSAVQDRLNKGMDDIASTMKTYYGDDTGNKLDTLLHSQVSDNIALIQAAKSKNAKAIQDAQARAEGNADDIAALMSGANTNLSKDDIASAMKQHVDLISSQTAARVKKDWKSDIDAYDRDEDQMMAFADKMIDGTAKQFPDKFVSPSSIAPASGP